MSKYKSGTIQLASISLYFKINIIVLLIYWKLYRYNKTSPLAVSIGNRMHLCHCRRAQTYLHWSLGHRTVLHHPRSLGRSVWCLYSVGNTLIIQETKNNSILQKMLSYLFLLHRGYNIISILKTNLINWWRCECCNLSKSLARVHPKHLAQLDWWHHPSPLDKPVQ